MFNNRAAIIWIAKYVEFLAYIFQQRSFSGILTFVQIVTVLQQFCCSRTFEENFITAVIENQLLFTKKNTIYYELHIVYVYFFNYFLFMLLLDQEHVIIIIL